MRANLVGGLDLFSPRSMWWPYHVAVSQRRYGHADRGFADGMALAIEHDVEMIRQFFLCYRARELLERGQWEEAEVLATRPIPGSSAETAPAHCHGHRRAAQGSRHEPGARELLEDVHAEEKPARPVVEWILRSTTALAELAWLSGNHAQVRALLEPTLVRALERGEPWWLGEVASGCGGWARWSSAGRMAEPYRLLLSGDWWAARPRRVGSHWLPLRGGPGPNRR